MPTLLELQKYTQDNPSEAIIFDGDSGMLLFVEDDQSILDISLCMDVS